MMEKEEKKSGGLSKSYSVEEAESEWKEDMNIMDYFQILNKTNYERAHFDILAQLTISSEKHKVLFGVVGLRKLLSLIDNPPIQTFINAGLIPVFLELSKDESIPRLQFEVLWCLTNIASGKTSHVQALVDKKAIPVFIKFLASPHKNIVEQSIWALGNVAGESSQFKSLILKEKAIKALGSIFKISVADSMLARNWAWCITNLLRGKPMPTFEDMFYLLPIYWEGLKIHTKKEILADLLWGISYMSDAGEKIALKLLELGVLESIIEAMKSKHSNVVLPSVRTLGNFVTGEDNETQTIIDSGVLPNLYALLFSEDSAIKKETCWTLSNIWAGTINQVASIIEIGIFDQLVVLATEEWFEIQREAGWCISNTTALKNEEIIQIVVQKQGLQAMLGVLKYKVDVKTAIVLLEGVKNILEVGKLTSADLNGINPYTILVEEWGGLEIIEGFQGHTNQHVYEISVEILEKIFSSWRDWFFSRTNRRHKTWILITT